MASPEGEGGIVAFVTKVRYGQTLTINGVRLLFKQTADVVVLDMGHIVCPDGHEVGKPVEPAKESA